MGFFGRKPPSGSSGDSSRQPPDEYAERGAAAIRSGDLLSGLEAYGNAIDKLHTMYVIGGCAHRQPSPSDNAIIAGFVGAARLVVDKHGAAAAGSAIAKSSDYLSQIAATAPQAGASPSLYLAYLEELSRL